MVRKLAAVMCTEEEIASVLGVSVELLHNSANNETFAECYKSGKEQGKASLRRTQYKLAEHNANMAIWLGKQYLGQRDSVETESGGVRVIVEGKVRDLSEGAPDD